MSFIAFQRFYTSFFKKNKNLFISSSCFLKVKNFNLKNIFQKLYKKKKLR